MIANQVKIPDPEKTEQRSKSNEKQNIDLIILKPMLPTTAMMAKNQTETGINLLIGKADIVKPNS